MGRRFASPSGSRRVFPGVVNLVAVVAVLLLGVIAGGAVRAAPLATDAVTMNHWMAVARQGKPAAGPFSDAIAIAPTADQSIDSFAARVGLGDFYAHVRFTNPVAASRHPWDIGVGFRSQEKNQQYRLIVESGGGWTLVWKGDPQPLATGTVANLATGAGQANALDLVADGGKAYFALNGVYVATLDVSQHTAPGDVWLSSAFFLDNTIAGQKTAFSNFSVWSLAAQSAGGTAAATGATTADAATMKQWEAVARAQAPLSGPANDAIDIAPSSKLDDVSSGVRLSDFYAHVVFTNPVAASQHTWDYGFGFRDLGPDQQYRIIVSSDGGWTFSWGPNQQPATGTVTNIATGAGQTNTLDLVAVGGKAYFAVNGVYAATLDVSQHTAPGDVWVSSGFFQDDHIAGQKAQFSAFTVWSLAVGGTPAAGATAPAATTATTATTADAATLNHWIAVARQQPAAAGPAAGSIAQSTSTLNVFRANVSLRDFYAHVRFTNPSAASQHAWDYGVGFRQVGSNQEYRLIIFSDGSWRYLWEADKKFSGTGTVPGLATGAGQANTVDLVVVGGKAYFAVNGKYVATLDVSKHTAAGDVWVSSAFYDQDTVAGAQTPYAEFTVWSLAAGAAGSPPAPTTTSLPPLLGPTPAATQGPILLGPTPTPRRVTGVNGQSYTSPTYGFTLTWTSEWSVVSQSSQGGTDALSLSDGPSTVAFQTTTSFGGDVNSCRSALVGQLSANSANSGVTQGTDANGKPLQGGNATSAWTVYLYTRAGAGGQKMAMARYMECWVLVPNRAVLGMIDDVPVDKFNAESPKLQTLLKSLVIPPAQPSNASGLGLAPAGTAPAAPAAKPAPPTATATATGGA